MRKIILTLVLLLSAWIGNAQAKSFVFNIDEVDSVTFNGQIFLIEDVRDGYLSIKGINVNNESVQVDSNSNIKIQFRNELTTINSQATMSTALSSGGDMGGGGK